MPGTISQHIFVVGIALTGALDKGDTSDFLAVAGAFDGAAVGRLGQLFQLRLVNHVRAFAITKLVQLAGIEDFGAGGLDDGTDILSLGGTGLGTNINTKLARRTAGARQCRVQVYSNF